MNDLLKKIEEAGVIAVIRLERAEDIIPVCEAVKKGGVTALEITMTTPGALDAIKQISSQNDPSVLIGVGTVLDVPTASRAIEAGAEFVVSPIFQPEVVLATKEAGKISMPGAFSPTEVYRAFQAGADVVKIFPASVGGANVFESYQVYISRDQANADWGSGFRNHSPVFECGCLGLGYGRQSNSC